MAVYHLYLVTSKMMVNVTVDGILDLWNIWAVLWPIYALPPGNKSNSDTRRGKGGWGEKYYGSSS